MRRTHQVLLLTALGVDVPLAADWRAAAAQAAAHFLSLHVLLGTPAIWSTVLLEAVDRKSTRLNSSHP